MVNRLPSKSLEGRRLRVILSPNVKEGSFGTVAAVDTETGNVQVGLEAGGTAVLNWGNGDRWLVVPAAAAHPAA